MNKVLEKIINAAAIDPNDKIHAKNALAAIEFVKYSAKVKVENKTNTHKGILGVFNLVDKEWQVECYLLSLHKNGFVVELTVKPYDKTF